MYVHPERPKYRKCSCGFTCHEKDSLMKNMVTCNKCGWVHFGVSREHAEAEVKQFNEYFDKLPKEKQDEYYGGKGSVITQYEHCMRCNEPHTNFRSAKYEDCPEGCTINPIIVDNS